MIRKRKFRNNSLFLHLGFDQNTGPCFVVVFVSLFFKFNFSLRQKKKKGKP